jgi:hypothetical protein
LKEGVNKAINKRKKKGKKGRNDGSTPVLEGIVSVMLRILQLAAGASTTLKN